MHWIRSEVRAEELVLFFMFLIKEIMVVVSKRDLEIKPGKYSEMTANLFIHLYIFLFIDLIFIN